jgi:hypothetical protein
LDGADQLTVADPLPAAADTPVGAPGTVGADTTAGLKTNVAISHGVFAPVATPALGLVPTATTWSSARNSMSLVGETLTRLV